MSCPLCGGTAFVPVASRRGVPILQNAPAPTAAEARAVPRGDLEIAACTACGFVFNRAFDPARVAYSDGYDNTQACSPQFERYLEELAARLIERHGLHGKRVVEVGCGKGQFLHLLARGNRGFGFDPTYIGPETAGDVTFVRELYGPEHAVPNTAFVCCRHVLEHVPDPLALLGAMRGAIEDGTPVFVEVPTIDWIVEHGCFWDLFYEHHSYFSADTLAFAAERAGFAVERVATAFDGQYLWLDARAAESSTRLPDAAPAIATVEAFAARTDAAIAALSAELATLAPGGVALWGAGAKGVTLANLLDPDARLIRCVVDINPRKQGGFIPGTGHPIVAPDALGDVRTVFGMNPVYRSEIEAAVARLGDIAVRWP